MKRLTVSLLLLMALIASVFSAAAPERIDNSELVIYTYDSFVAEWGPGPIIIPAFEQENQVDLRQQKAPHSIDSSFVQQTGTTLSSCSDSDKLPLESIPLMPASHYGLGK